MNRLQTIFRNAGPDRAYTKLSNAMLQDERLSLETRGLLVSLLSRPVDWETTFAGIMAAFQIGETRATRIIKEAKKHGYVRIHRDRRSDGTLGPVIYLVTDCPDELERAIGDTCDHSGETRVVEEEDSTKTPENAHSGETHGVDDHSGEIHGVGSDGQTNKRYIQTKKHSSLRSECKKTGADAPAEPKGLERKPTRLPDNWQLPPDWMDWTLGEFTASRAQIADAAASFRDYWCGKPGAQAKKLDWLATWRNWCRKEFRRQRRDTGAHAAPPSAAQLERQKWEGRMKIYADSSRWPRDKWGPVPGEPGCQVPPDLLRARGVRLAALVA